MFFITKFINKDGKIINLKEAAAAAPEGEKSTSNTGETSDTGTESNENDTNTETNQEDTSTENQEDSSTENNDQQNPESEDMSSEDGMDFGGDTSGDGSSDDTSSSDTNSSSADPGNEEEVDENKKAEEEIFSNLTHDQLDIKHKELKNQYLQLYDMTSEIIDRISSINISEDITFVVDYVSTTLSNLRDMVVDYINDVYKTKSYTENLINYNRFLATLSGINKILEEIDKTEEDKT